MADDNADRIRGSAQHPVPERDIEPLWPPEPDGPVPADGHWPGGGPELPPTVDTTAYPSLSYLPPPPGPPVVPGHGTAGDGGDGTTPGTAGGGLPGGSGGRADAQAAAVGTPGEWAMTGPPNAGWTPIPHNGGAQHPYPATQADPPAPTSAAQAGPVVPATGAAAGASGAHPAGNAAGASGAHPAGNAAGAAGGPPAGGGAPGPRATQRVPVDLNAPFTLDEPSAAAGPPARDAVAAQAAEQGPARGSQQSPAQAAEQGPMRPAEQGPMRAAEQSTVQTAEQGPARAGEQSTMRAAEQGPARGGEQGTGAGGRAQPESPWAQPPQRPGTAAGDARGEAAATGPVRDGSALQPSPPQPPSHQQAASGQQSTADPQQPADAQAVPTVPQEPQAGRHRPVIPQQPVAPPQAGAEPVAAHPAHQQPAHQHPDQQHAAHQHPGQQHPAHQHPGQQHAAQQRPAQHPPYGPGPEQQPPGPVPQQPSPGPWAAQSGGGWAGPAPSSAGGWAGAVPPQPQPGPVPPATKAGGVEAGGVEAGATAAGVAGAGGRRPGPLPPTFNPPGPVPAVPPPGPVPPVPGPATAAAPSGPVSPVPPGPVPQQGGGWYPPPWQPGVGQPGMPVGQPGMPPVPGQQAYPEPAWTPETGAPPTAEDFARRRQIRPPDPVATVGFRAVINKTGLVKLPPGRHEQELRRDIEMVRRNFGGLRQVTVVNPKGGAGKTVAILLLAMTFGQKRGGYVLAWDNNETQGTLGMRAQQDFHSRTVRDMLRDLGQFQGAHGRVGDLSQYVRSQGEGMFDVLASDESATGGEMLTASAFAELREVVSRFYKLIFVDTGNNVRAQNWQAAMDATDQLVVTMSARNDSAETAARMLDHLEQSGRQRLVRQAVTVVSMPPSRKEIDLPAIQQHFAARTRAVLLAPYERLIDSGEPIRYSGLSSATRDAWLKIAASVAEGL